jgi:uncharacterized cupin superfamily protein
MLRGMGDRHPNLVNEADLPWQERGHGERFAVKTKRLGAATGGRKLGCSLYEQPPGKRAFPYHCHFSNEEGVYVLEGEGTLRIGGKEVPLRAGDYVAFPVGEETAHQIINTSTAMLRYLCFSTQLEPEMVKYPDSGKVGLWAGTPTAPAVRTILRLDAGLDYWDGED